MWRMVERRAEERGGVAVQERVALVSNWSRLWLPLLSGRCASAASFFVSWEAAVLLQSLG